MGPFVSYDENKVFVKMAPGAFLWWCTNNKDERGAEQRAKTLPINNSHAWMKKN